MTTLDILEKNFNKEVSELKETVNHAKEQILKNFNNSTDNLEDIYKHQSEYCINSIDFCLCDKEKIMLRIVFQDNSDIRLYAYYNKIELGGEY